MKTCMSSIRINDDDFKRYQKDAEDIEKLIKAAERNYMQIERLRQAHTFVAKKQKLIARKKARFSSMYK